MRVTVAMIDGLVDVVEVVLFVLVAVVVLAIVYSGLYNVII